MRKGTAMTKYFSQDTPLAGLERMMMSVPGFQKRGGGMMVLCRFHYKKEDVDCTYCRSYMRHTCQESVCPYIPERLEAGTIGYETLTDDPAIRKQVDDILYDLYGEENPRPLEDYENTPQEGMTMGGMT